MKGIKEDSERSYGKGKRGVGEDINSHCLLAHL